MQKAIFLAIAMTLGAASQSVLNKADSKVSILGTSTLHDWHMSSNEYYTTGTLSYTNGVFTATNYKIVFPVKELESGKETMDDYAHEALKDDKNPNITFALQSVSGTGAAAKALGQLTIAGVTKNVSIPVRIEDLGNTNKVVGDAKINMTEYGVEPPSVMFGTIECGDEVTIEFQFAFNLK
ncbi:hypothetical protein GC194_10180 [bacterium]|nr:hypothetical protein [bacterium]